MKEILMLLTDQWADWEAAFVIADLNMHPDYTVKTVAADDVPKVSLGGIRAEIDCTLDSYNSYDNLAMLIVPGGLSWWDNDFPEIVEFIRAVAEKQIPIAAICGSVCFLARHGFLNHVKHTANALELLQDEQGYMGEKLYVETQAVADGGFITANESAAVEFAYEIFKVLKLGDDYEDKNKWFDYYKNGAIAGGDHE